MVKEYIEREIPLQQIRAEALNLLEQEGRRTNEVLAYGHCFGIVASAPAADVVEVVRCGHCKFYKESRYFPNEKICGLSHLFHSEDFFCAFGKRKDNETN